jgi:hypothetical protein
LLAGLDQLGQLVVTLLEQDVDVRPGFADVVLKVYQLVEDEYAEDSEQGQHDKKNQKAGHDVLQIG